VTLYLADPVPDGYKWYKYSPTSGWYECDENAVFNSARDQVTLTLVDGGIGDDDGVANGMISDPVVLGIVHAQDTADNTADSEESGGKHSGCFITTASH
jgi:hypothetical protein